MLTQQHAAEFSESFGWIVEGPNDSPAVLDRESENHRFHLQRMLEDARGRLVDDLCELADELRADGKAGEHHWVRSYVRLCVEGLEWVAARAETRKPGTLKQYLTVFRSLLDHAGVEPNPARDPRVRLPKQVRDEANPPPADHFLAILGALLPKWRLFFVTLEQGGLRISEAVSLRWADVDVAGLRLRLPKSATKSDRSRWVYLPDWLMEAIEATCPLEDRVPGRRVFQGLELSAARQAMTRACREARVPHYSPHDLRHRRITIWHQSGVPARELAERAGHARPSMSLDVYSHVMPPDEVASERFLTLI